ncbi:unnamed protein product [Heligmosomoides polygyrus]|uniref:MFS domain-containing protein n=1 Tax=Heligmosomoides polygyrus TaxID=6339 RepID=A0A183GUA5_HELPZ|nr:unnamed protein product [Heligmosomoides polygyrus]
MHRSAHKSSDQTALFLDMESWVLSPRNPFLLSCVLITGLTWTVVAMNGMSTAFITQSCENCSDMVSLVDEYSLRGSRAYMSDAITTAFMVGNGVGGTIISKAADRYGRRPVLIFCFVMMAFTGVLAALSPTVLAFGVLRFLQGIFYTVRLVPESLHFLALDRRDGVVADWLKKAGRCQAGVAAIDPSTVVSTRQPEPEITNLVAELWAHKKFLLYTVVLVYLWNCDTFIYFGLSLYSTHFAGDIYMNYFLVGLVEVPAYILSPIAMNRKVLFSNRPIIEVDGYAAFITRSEPGN